MRYRRLVGVSALIVMAAFALQVRAQSRNVGNAFTAGEESLWRIQQGDTDIGHCWSRYEGEVELGPIRAHRFTAQVLLDAQVPGGRLVQRFTADLWTDSGGHPLKISFRASASDVRAAVDAVFADGRVEARVQQGPVKQSHETTVGDDVFILANNFISHLDLALALAAPPAGEKGSLSFFSANSLKSFQLNLDPVAGGAGTAGGAVFRDSLGEVLHLDDLGRLQLVEIPAQKIAFVRSQGTVDRFSIDLPTQGWQPQGMDLEEVRIEYGEVSLAGTITRPKGATGPLPAVTFVSGSGGQDRNGYSGGLDLGTHEILDRLTHEGFLVLRVDDRGVGGSTGPTDGMTFDDLVEDARHTVLFLQSRPDVDPSRIAVIGHSEGGEIAPILAARMDVAAIVLMAAPGRNVIDIAHEQLRAARERSGESIEQLDDFDRVFQDFKDRVINDKPIEADKLPPDLAVFLPARAWMKSHAAQDPVANLKKVHTPVLVLQGGRDIQVSPERDTRLLERALESSGNPDFKVVVFPELDHLFKKTVGDESSGLDYLKERPIDPEFLEVLVGWLKARLMED